MTARPNRPLSPAFWIGLPMAACVVASIVLATPIRIAGLQAPEPAFALIPAFAWGAARPSIVPPFALVVLGIFLDLLWGGPLGLWPACLLTAYALVFFARPILAGQEFWALWAAYVVACAGAMTVGVALTSFRAGHAPDLLGVGLQFGVSAALFPFAWRLLERYEVADTRFR
jgi:rod shape-determining protein MreD